jgi:hypothetical protein
MKQLRYVFTLTLFVIFTLASGLCFADHDRGVRTYEVTITNLTRGQVFSPPIVFSHNRNFSLFTLGEPASAKLYPLAEDGDRAPLINYINTHSSALDYDIASDFLPPGHSVTLEITASGHHRYISAAGM